MQNVNVQRKRNPGDTDKYPGKQTESVGAEQLRIIFEYLEIIKRGEEPLFF